MKSALGWSVLLMVAVMLIITGFMGRVGSLLAALIAPSYLQPVDGSDPGSNPSGADTQPAVGGHCSTPDQVVSVGGALLWCDPKTGTWQQVKT